MHDVRFVFTSSSLQEDAYLICVCLRIEVYNTYCVVYLDLLFFVLLPVSLDCPFFIAPSVFSNGHLQCIPDKGPNLSYFRTYFLCSGLKYGYMSFLTLSWSSGFTLFMKSCIKAVVYSIMYLLPYLRTRLSRS